MHGFRLTMKSHFKKPSISIIMPCLNEAATLERCIHQAQRGLQDADIDGEIIIADNGSTDGSIEIAKRSGAMIVSVLKKGYGHALRGGIEASSSPWILIGDSDDSYDFSKLRGFIEKLEEGYDVVSGCRLPSGGGTILRGAMPWKNRWIGNPGLSWLGKILFKTEIHDFHCGMKAFTKRAYEFMDLQTTGMEFISEMVIKSAILKLKITQTPITLYPDGRGRIPHLKPWRDGWRNLRFMLIYSPQWLFFMPGLLMSLTGFLVMVKLYVSPIIIQNVMLDTGAMMIAAMALILGFVLTVFAVSTKIFATLTGLMPEDPNFNKLFNYFHLERGILLGLFFIVGGGWLIAGACFKWYQVHFEGLSCAENMRQLIPGATLTILGIQIMFTSFFLSFLGLKTFKNSILHSSCSL